MLVRLITLVCFTLSCSAAPAGYVYYNQVVPSAHQYLLPAGASSNFATVHYPAVVHSSPYYLTYPGRAPIVYADEKPSEGSGGLFGSVFSWVVDTFNPTTKPPESPEAPTSTEEPSKAEETPEKVVEGSNEVKPVSENVDQRILILGHPQFYGNYNPNRHLLPGFQYVTLDQNLNDAGKIQARISPPGSKDSAVSFNDVLVVASATDKEKEKEEGATSEDSEKVEASEAPGPSVAQVKPQAIALAGPGGVAAAAPVGTALVGPGGLAVSSPSATAVAGPSGGAPPVAPAAANSASSADAYKLQLFNSQNDFAGDDH